MSLDLLLIIKGYVSKMLSEAAVGMKALILDDFTINVVGAAFSHTELLKREVFLVEKINSTSESAMHHLKAVFFVRPSRENVTLLCDILKADPYGDYYLYFSNLLRETDMQTLAEADEREAVSQIQEVFACFVALDPTLFTLNVPRNHEFFSVEARRDVSLRIVLLTTS